MLVLAIDTASIFCSAALMEDGFLIAEQSENIGRGHAEYLLEQIQQLMSKAQKDFAAIDKIVVNIGPGSFTGIRVGVAAARALSLAINKPLLGVNAFQALHYQVLKHVQQNATKAFCVILKGSQNQFYWQYFASNEAPVQNPLAKTATDPQTGFAEDIMLFLAKQHSREDFILVGNGGEHIALDLAEQMKTKIKLEENSATASISSFAEIAFHSHDEDNFTAHPLYMRAPDAKPQARKPLFDGKKQFRKQSGKQQKSSQEKQKIEKFNEIS